VELYPKIAPPSQAQQNISLPQEIFTKLPCFAWGTRRGGSRV